MHELSGEEVQQRLSESFRERIPSGQEIAAESIARALVGHEEDVDWIKTHFSDLIEQVQLSAYDDYLEAESSAGSEAMVEVFAPLLPRDSTGEDGIRLIADRFHALDRFFLSLTQGRRPRAGKTFELLIRELFVRLRYPFSSQPVINGQPDFVLPSADHFRRHATDCVIFTVKRTLRERWRQIVTEGTRGLGFFLATIDENVAARDLREMLASRITLVVPERIRHVRPDYEQADNVISFEQFFRFYLDPAVERWRETGVI